MGPTALGQHPPMSSLSDHFHRHLLGGIRHPLLGDRPTGGSALPQEGAKWPAGRAQPPAGDPPLGDLPTGTPCLSPVSSHTSRRSTCGTSSKQHNFYQKKSQKHRTSTGMSHENQSSSESRSASPDFSVGMYVYV